MKFALRLLIALAVALGIAAALTWDRGYALLSYGGWTVEMALSTLLLLVTLGVIAVLILVRSLLWLWRLPRRLRELRQKRLMQRARRSLLRGLIEFSEGRYAASESELLRYAKDSDVPLLNYLGAARAAQMQREYGRRDEYLRAAYEVMPSAVQAVLLTQAELQTAAHQREQALATLRRLQEIKPGHPYGLRLLARLYRELEDWDNLELLLPRLRKSPMMRPEEIEQLEILTLTAQIRRRAKTGSADEIKALWKTIPKRLRQTAELARAYVAALIEVGAESAAELAIRTALKTTWDEELVLAYGRVRSKTPTRQLARVEEWLAERHDDAALLLTAGRLCIAAQLWGKARSYLQTSLAIAPRVDTYQELGELLQTIGEHDEAATAFRHGLELSLTGKVTRGRQRRKRKRPAFAAPDEEPETTTPGFVRSTN